MKNWAGRKIKKKTRKDIQAELEWCRQRIIEINQGKPCPVLKVIQDGDHIRVVQIQPPWLEGGEGG